HDYDDSYSPGWLPGPPTRRSHPASSTNSPRQARDWRSCWPPWPPGPNKTSPATAKTLPRRPAVDAPPHPRWPSLTQDHAVSEFVLDGAKTLIQMRHSPHHVLDPRGGHLSTTTERSTCPACILA